MIKPDFVDIVPLKKRVDDLELVFSDIENITFGRVSKEKLIEANYLLDIGCGVGAFGCMLRNLGSKAQIVGVDKHVYERDNCYHVYDQLYIKDIQNVDFLKKLHVEFDVVMAIGLPPIVARFLYDNRKMIKRRDGGLFVLVVDEDANVDDYSEADIFKGNIVIDRSVLLL